MYVMLDYGVDVTVTGLATAEVTVVQGMCPLAEALGGVVAFTTFMDHVQLLLMRGLKNYAMQNELSF